MKTKTPSASATIKTEVVCPNDTNPMGILQGGRMVQWMDIAAAICAQNHAEKICVTVSIDCVKFRSSARIGDIITIRAFITRAFTTSMEIMVTAHAKNIISQEEHLVNEARFTFVALDDRSRPTPVPPVRPVTKEEIRLFAEALERKQQSADSRPAETAPVQPSNSRRS